MEQPDLSDYRLALRASVPLDRRWRDPDEGAFERWEVTLQRHGLDGEAHPVASAVVFRVRWDSGEDLIDAADAQGDSEFVDIVCAEALNEFGEVHDFVQRALPDAVATEVFVVGRVEAVAAGAALPFGLLGRGILEVLGRVGGLFFFESMPTYPDIWSRSVGAVRAGDFEVASSDFVLPEFPLSPLDGR